MRIRIQGFDDRIQPSKTNSEQCGSGCKTRMVFKHKIVAFVPLKKVIGRAFKNLTPVIS
jgi:hypothetical protein